jgi:hypothetical protein
MLLTTPAATETVSLSNLHPGTNRVERYHRQQTIAAKMKMKIAQASLLALLVPAASARFIEANELSRVSLHTDWATQVDETTPKYHIELAPGETRWVTEDEKWELRRVSIDTFPWPLTAKDDGVI